MIVIYRAFQIYMYLTQYLPAIRLGRKPSCLECLSTFFKPNDSMLYSNKLNSSKSTDSEIFLTWVSKNNAHLELQSYTC